MLFAGHGVEIDGEAYLVPIEGELGVAASLIPLKWVYQQLEQCKARQKLFIVDVCRLNPSRSVERPAGGPMSPKFDLALKNPPPGVQVWAACTEGQQSYEFEDARISNGLFMEALYEAADRGVEGVIQRPNDPFPVKQMVARQRETQGRVGAAQADADVAAVRCRTGGRGRVQPGGVGSAEADGRRPGRRQGPGRDAPGPQRPQGTERTAGEEEPDGRTHQLRGHAAVHGQGPGSLSDGQHADAARDAIEHAQAVLWALSPNAPPPEVAEAVRKIKQSGELKADLNSLRESVRAQGGGNAEKLQGRPRQRWPASASMLRLLEDELDAMKKAKEMRPRRRAVAGQLRLHAGAAGGANRLHLRVFVDVGPNAQGVSATQRGD